MSLTMLPESNLRLGVGPLDKRHDDRVAIAAIDPASVALHALPAEAKFFVEGDSARIISIDIQFDANESRAARSLQGGGDQARSDPFAAPGRHDAHAQRSPMGARGDRVAANIAPANDGVVAKRDDHGTIFFEALANVLPNVIDRRRLQHCKIATFARDDVEYPTKALRVVKPDRRDLDLPVENHGVRGPLTTEAGRLPRATQASITNSARRAPRKSPTRAAPAARA